MCPAYLLPETADSAEGSLDSGITAASSSLVLGTGEGALFPQPITGTATSTGTSSTLNDTGIGASGIVAGDFIENITDNSHAFVVSVSTNSITTTTLQGGSDNTWQSSDNWAVKRFIVTVNARTDGAITKSEKVLIGSRSGDTLSVAASGRGYDGSTAQSFDAADYVSLFSVSLHHEGAKAAIGEVARAVRAIEADYTTEAERAATVSDTAYGAGWNGDTTHAPSKNAVYDKIESMAVTISDTAYDATTWDGVTNVAPSKNAVRDKIALIDAEITQAKVIEKMSGDILIYSSDEESMLLDDHGNIKTLTLAESSYFSAKSYTLHIIAEVKAVYAGSTGATFGIRVNNNYPGGSTQMNVAANSSAVYQWMTGTLDINVTPGDTIAIYATGPVVMYYYVRNFRVYAHLLPAVS